MCQQCQRFNQPCICNNWGSKSFQIAEQTVSLGEGMRALCPFPHRLVHLLICIFYNKSVNINASQSCANNSRKLVKSKERKVETSIYRWWVRSVGKTTWGFWLEKQPGASAGGSVVGGVTVFPQNPQLLGSDTISRGTCQNWVELEDNQLVSISAELLSCWWGEITTLWVT